MLTLEEIKHALRDRRLDIVSEQTGIHRATISRIRNDDNANPTYAVIKTLSDYLRGVSLDG
jgi:transcriptional regulator with XRE-family HTH domain